MVGEAASTRATRGAQRLWLGPRRSPLKRSGVCGRCSRVPRSWKVQHLAPRDQAFRET